MAHLNMRKYNTVAISLSSNKVLSRAGFALACGHFYGAEPSAVIAFLKCRSVRRTIDPERHVQTAGGGNVSLRSIQCVLQYASASVLISSDVGSGGGYVTPSPANITVP